MKALVTGGSGYFGSVLVNRLLEKGFDVGSLDINEPDVLPKEVTFHKIDIRDKDSLMTDLIGYDIIFHNVAQVPLAKNNKLFWEVNVKGTENICEVSLTNNIKKIIYTSSSAIYGVPKENPVDENSVPMPREGYGRAKLKGEIICKDYNKKGIDLSIIRPRTIMGHGRLGIFSILFKWISEGVNIPVLNNGSNIYQFVHADDLADACILAANNNDQFSCYNIGASDYDTMRNTLENLCDYADTGSKVYSLPLRPIEFSMNILSLLNLIPLGPYHSLMYGRSLYFNINKAQVELEFKPKISTERMFIESYEWYLDFVRSNKLKGKGSKHQKPINESLLKVLRWFSK